MVDEPDTVAPASDTGRPKRPPPTIDLEPTSREERPSAAESAAERPTASPWSAPAEAVAEAPGLAQVEAAKADGVNMVIMDRAWVLWKQKAQSTK